MSNLTELRQKVRHQRKKNELGEKACCQICGETELSTLRKVPKHLFEVHHIAGARDGETITVCANCHARLSANQLDWPQELLSRSRTPEMKAVAFFLGLGSVLSLLGMWCIRHAQVLFDFVKKHSLPHGGV